MHPSRAPRHQGFTVFAIAFLNQPKNLAHTNLAFLGAFSPTGGISVQHSSSEGYGLSSHTLNICFPFEWLAEQVAERHVFCG
jgi:hypothetical protein